jgi:hypothetical protein
MRSSIVPTRVSHRRSRKPLRCPVRSGVRSNGSAPSWAVTSESINTWASTRTPSRRTSMSDSARTLPTNSVRSMLRLATATSSGLRTPMRMAVAIFVQPDLLKFPPLAGTLTGSRGTGGSGRHGRRWSAMADHQGRLSTWAFVFSGRHGRHVAPIGGWASECPNGGSTDLLQFLPKFLPARAAT